MKIGAFRWALAVLLALELSARANGIGPVFEITGVALAPSGVASASLVNPDLTVAPGQKMTAYVRIRNNSPTGGDAGALSVWIDWPSTFGVLVPPPRILQVGYLGSFASRTIKISDLTAPQGLGVHQCRTAIAGNNGATKTLSAPGSTWLEPYVVTSRYVDLRISQAWVTPYPLVRGAQMTAHIVVENTGTVSAEGAGLALLAGNTSAPFMDPGVKRVSIGRLMPQERRTIRLSGLQAPDQVTLLPLRAVVDFRGDVAESDEGNNEWLWRESVLQAFVNFEVVSLWTSPGTVRRQAPLTAYVWVYNSGTVAADAGRLDLWMTKSRTGSPWRSIPAGVIEPYSFKFYRITSLRTSALGEHVLEAVIDGRSRVAETDETDNAGGTVFEVIP